MNKILRILISFARAERVVALNQVVRSDFVVILTIRASRSFQSRTKTKNFLAFPFKTAGGAGGSRKKLKGNFMVLFSPLHSFKKDLYLYLGQCQYSVRPFLRHSRRARRYLSAFCGNSRVRSHFAITSHWPLASLTLPARCLLCVRSVASSVFVVVHCACPTRPVRAQAKLPYLFQCIFSYSLCSCLFFGIEALPFRTKKLSVPSKVINTGLPLLEI